jgi:hypothetical protein
MIISLQDFKDKKKIKKFIKDINTILKIIDLSEKGLSHFPQYSVVQDMLNVLKSNKTLLELHRKKYESKLEEIEKKHSE